MYIIDEQVTSGSLWLYANYRLSFKFTRNRNTITTAVIAEACHITGEVYEVPEDILFNALYDDTENSAVLTLTKRMCERLTRGYAYEYHQFALGLMNNIASMIDFITHKFNKYEEYGRIRYIDFC